MQRKRPDTNTCFLEVQWTPGTYSNAPMIAPIFGMLYPYLLSRAVGPQPLHNDPQKDARRPVEYCPITPQ